MSDKRDTLQYLLISNDSDDHRVLSSTIDLLIHNSGNAKEAWMVIEAEHKKITEQHTT